MTVMIVTLSALFFLAMIMNLAAKPKFTRGLIGACTFLAAAGGILLYGIGFSYTLQEPVQMIIRTAFAVSRMYAGVNDFASVSAASIFSSKIVVTIFWLLHLMAFYAMASATISAIGASALKKLKYWLQRYGASVIIFGINDDSVEFGRDLISKGTKNVVFVGAKADPALETAINGAGALLRSDLSALNPDRSFLKSLGSEKGTPELTVYVMDTDTSRNIVYAEGILSALQESSVDPSKVRLVLRGADDSVETKFLRTAEHYGYGEVKCYSDASMAARLLMQQMPPCDKMYFDENGLADGDFDALVVGFGKTARNVLRQLTANAQFEGSHFRVAVFSPGSEKENGYFLNSYPGLMDNYDIRFFSEDAKSPAFYNYIKEHIRTLRYVVICTGNQTADAEISSDVASFLKVKHCDAALCRCNAKAIAWSVDPKARLQYRSVYSADVLGSDRVDREAMMLNHSYVNDPSVTPEAAWASCDYFSRESSRASADFIRAFLKIAGRSEEETIQNGWGDLSEEQKLTMAKTEHLRWNAFHYSMGFESMTEEEIRARGTRYRNEVEANGSSGFRIGKDLTGRKHACLRSWEELDGLSALEKEYTGKLVDYKDMDLRNVLQLPAVLKASKGEKK